MPRNSTGNYTLPAGNPVVPNTIIETTWANPTMSDIGAALSDSLDRQGRGTMLAPLKIMDGTVVSPSLAFNSNTNTGMYLAAANTIGFAVGGVLGLTLSVTGVTIAQGLHVSGVAIIDGTTTFNGTLGIPQGTALLPGLFFNGDPDTGIWSPGANRVGIAAAGAGVLTLTNTLLNGSSASGTTDIIMGDATSDVPMLQATKRTANTRSLVINSEYGFASAQKAAEFYNDLITFHTNFGVERMRIDSTGFVTFTGGGSFASNFIAPNFYVGTTTAAAGQFGVASNNGASVTAWGNAAPGAGRLDLNAGGAARVIVDTAGNVGINRSPPAYRLDSREDTVGAKQFRFGGAGMASLYGYCDSAGSGITNADPVSLGSLLFMGGQTMGMYTAGLPRLTVDAAGGVGIGGAASPGPRLEIFDTNPYMQLTGSTVKTFLQAASADSIGIVGTISNHPFTIWANSTEKMRIDTAGNVGIGGVPTTAALEIKRAGATEISLQVGANTSATGFSLFKSGIDAYVINRVAGLLILGTADSESMRITAVGDIGVGFTPNGTAKFSVASANFAIPTGGGQIYALSKDAMAANLGGQIVMGGSYTGGSDTTFAAISGRKENATAGNIAGYLSLSTNQDGVGMRERMRINSTGTITQKDGLVVASDPGALPTANIPIGGIVMADDNTQNTPAFVTRVITPGLPLTVYGMGSGADASITSGTWRAIGCQTSTSSIGFWIRVA